MKANSRKQQPGQQTISVMVADGPLLSSSTLVMFLDNADGIDVVALAENKDAEMDACPFLIAGAMC